MGCSLSQLKLQEEPQGYSPRGSFSVLYLHMRAALRKYDTGQQMAATVN